MASDTALFIKWDRPFAGRESAALDLFKATTDYFTGLVKEDRLESFEPAMLAPHGGDMHGMILLRGNAEQIDRVRRSRKFQELILRADHVLTKFGVLDGHIGLGMEVTMQKWALISAR